MKKSHAARLGVASLLIATASWVQAQTPSANYFGGVPNYTNSPPLRKFVDPLPRLGCDPQNPNTPYIPVAKPITQTVFPNDDYYEIELREYAQQMHTDLPKATKLRGYFDANPAAATDGCNASARRSYLGPVIVANKDKPVRIKFTNKLGTGTAGNLFIPVDASLMGAGMGPKTAQGADCDPAMAACASYTHNRAVLHLHGGDTPWISDGTPHQWIVPAGENTPFLKGVSQQNVPDMWFNPTTHALVAAGTAGATNDPGAGSATFYYPNGQPARLMFYHDHSLGLTRLNVYVGEAAGYLITDATEAQLIANGVLPDLGTPLVLQDKTFVPNDATIAATDPTWKTAPGSASWGAFGDLWFPHVYMPNQNPNNAAGANDMGRWDYGPWFWPPVTFVENQPLQIVGDGTNGCAVGQTCTVPNIPNPSTVPEGFHDTPVVNGVAYPTMTVQRKPYRFRILNAANDRFWNLQFYYAVDANGAVCNSATTSTGCTEVKMVDAVPRPLCSATVTTNCVCDGANTPAGCFPPSWPTDSRDGGVPDPATAGPTMVQIGTEGGFLPAPVDVPPQPVNYVYDRRNIVVLNVGDHSLFMGPAERADVLVDFSTVPDGATLILYNDSPAPVPAADPRLDYYTGNPDFTPNGGHAPTVPGYGPNTRTVMQFKVSGGSGTALNRAALDTALPLAFTSSQPAILVPEPEYGPTYGTTFPDNYARIQSTSLTFTPVSGGPAVTVPLLPKAIHELFELKYGRMNALLGVERPLTDFTTQTTIPYYYVDPPTELFKDGQTQYWKITHNGVDTHAIHFHLVNVQVLNRVGWDGAIRPPDGNELGWKETVRMNPLEDIVVALRAKTPKVPFAMPNSVRPLDPTMPIGSTGQFTGVDPNNNPITVVNQFYNFGHEYVWHCHLLGHEENDMMRPVVVGGREAHDLNGDGVADILWQNTSTGQLYAWFMAANGTVPSQGLVGGARVAPWKVAGAGDFDGDGYADIMWFNTTTSEVVIRFARGLDVVREVSLGSPGTQWELVATGDFDNDGKTDVLWRNTVTGQGYVWLMNGTSVTGQGFSGGTLSGNFANWTAVATADFNGDGRADVLWRHTNGNVAVWLMNGTTVQGQGTLGGAGSPWVFVGLGDLDGDRKADIVWRNSTTGQAYVWFINGTTIASQGLVYGAAPLTPVANWRIGTTGDINFDQMADIVWHNTVTGEVQIWTMNGLAVTGTFSPGAPPTVWQVVY